MSGDSRTSSPENSRSRTVDRHGNKIIRLKDRLGNGVHKPQKTAHPDTPFNQEARVNIYERPHGPRTGIGYVKAGILEVRFVVPSKVAGSVIGKGGDLVQQLRKKHDCEIGVPVSETSIDRVVVVRGKSVRNVIDCVCSIADYPLKKEMCRGLNLQPDCSQIRLLLHQTICGNVIGKGGEIIHEIRTEAGTDVHMYNEVCPRSTDRICRITGKISEIRDALAMIFKFTGDTNTKGKESDYDAKNSTGNEDGRDYGGWRLSEVRHMGAPEHSDDYAHNKKGRKPPKYDRHGNLRSDNLTEHTRDKKRSRDYDSESDSDDPQKRIQREIKAEFNSRSRTGAGRSGGNRANHHQVANPPPGSGYQGKNYNPNFQPANRGGHSQVRGNVRSNYGGNDGDSGRGGRANSRDRHGNKKVKSYRDRDDEDAPVYEGPNSSGPNRQDRKREHPLTALDLKRMHDREESGRGDRKQKRSRGLLDDE